MTTEPKRRFSLFGVAFASLAALSLLILGACATANNERSLGELVDHMESCGLNVSEVGPLSPEPAGAEMGVYIKIAGRDIGLYKFDVRRKKQKEKLEHAVTKGFIGVMGIKYGEGDFLINGSFVIIDFKNNPEAKKIASAFKSF